ncbi:MAG: reprolysin-like metallopeptidase, partial [Bacteroidia bacterium]
TYRLAVACTGEYAVAATGTSSPSIAQTLAKIVTSVNRVDGVYETEVAVRMVLIATETVVVYTDATTDPFTGNNNANTLINESQTVIGGNIGSANYDIGHTFSTGGGGLAYLGCVCTTSKARGITGSPSPVGDPYDIDYVAHEMGHQFGGNHSFNSITSSCGGGNRNAGTAVEPGSGITIMAYAGICGSDDLAAHSIAYFHGISYDEIVNYTNSGAGNSCAVTTTTGNNPPSVTGSITYTIPKSTPFSLTGSATDPDGDPLTYSWEEMDLGPGSGGAWNSGTAPYFESNAPIASPTRMFPKLAVVLSGLYTTTKGEYLPSTAQTLKFRLTARDNKMGGGGVCSASSQVVIDNSGPLAITYPNAAGIIWPTGSTQTITWNVNGTDVAPVSCTNVNVLLSYDNGTTFTTTLMASTANNGSLTITVPTVTTTMTNCRIRVESVGNIFFDINDRVFTISTVTGLNEMSSNNGVNLLVAPNPFSDSFTLKAGSLDAGSETVVTITDVLGKIIKQESIGGVSNLNRSFSLDGLSRGLYFVSVKNSTKQSVVRVVKQ